MCEVTNCEDYDCSGRLNPSGENAPTAKSVKCVFTMKMGKQSLKIEEFVISVGRNVEA